MELLRPTQEQITHSSQHFAPGSKASSQNSMSEPSMGSQHPASLLDNWNPARRRGMTATCFERTSFLSRNHPTHLTSWPASPFSDHIPSKTPRQGFALPTLSTPRSFVILLHTATSCGHSSSQQPCLHTKLCRQHSRSAKPQHVSALLAGIRKCSGKSQGTSLEARHLLGADQELAATPSSGAQKSREANQESGNKARIESKSRTGDKSFLESKELSLPPLPHAA